MSSGVPPPTTRSRHGYRWCLVFPFVWQAGLAPVVNDIGFKPFGLPFPMAWQLLGIVLTSAVIAWVFRRDADAGVDAEEAAFLAANESRTGEPR